MPALRRQTNTEPVDSLWSLINDHALGRRLGAANCRRALTEYSYAERLGILVDLVL